MGAALNIDGLNDWKIIDLLESCTAVDEEILEVFESTLAQIELEASVEMEDGNFAA